MLDWFDKIKEIIELDAAKRNLLFGYLFFIAIIIYLYQDNQSLKDQAITIRQEERANLIEERKLCSEQLVANRTEYQRQFTEFTLQSNESISEMNKEYINKAKVYLNRIRKINEELIELKNESIN